MMTDLVKFYDKHSHIWIVFSVDKDGNQLGDAEFYPNKRVMQSARQKQKSKY